MQHSFKTHRLHYVHRAAIHEYVPSAKDKGTDTLETHVLNTKILADFLVKYCLKKSAD